MEFWFYEYDNETLQKPFLKVNYLKYLQTALVTIPEEEMGQIAFSENRLEKRLQQHLIEQQSLFLQFFTDLNSIIDDKKSDFKQFLRIALLFLQVEKLYYIQYWEFDCAPEFIIDRLFASFIRFYRFLLIFHKILQSSSQLKSLKSSEMNENGLDRLFNKSLQQVYLEKSLLLPMDDLMAFKDYLTVSLKDLLKTFEKSVSNRNDEKSFLNQIVFISEKYIDFDMNSLQMETKTRFGNCEYQLINKILNENIYALDLIKALEEEMNLMENTKQDQVFEKDFLNADQKYIELIGEAVSEQYNPTPKKPIKEIKEENDNLSDKNFSRQTSQQVRDSVYEGVAGSDKKVGKRTTFMKSEIDSFPGSRKTIMKEDADVSKKSKLGQGIFPIAFNKEKKTSRLENTLKIKNFSMNRTISSVGREKSDSITEIPQKELINIYVSKYLFDKDFVQNYNSLQPQIETQKNLQNVVEDTQYINSPNFLRNFNENPLLSWMRLNDAKKSEEMLDFQDQSMRYGLGMANSNSNHIKRDKINGKDDLLVQMNEKLSEHLMNVLTSPGNSAEIRPEDIKYDRFDEKKEELELRKKKAIKKDGTNSTQKTEENEAKLHQKQINDELNENEDKKNKNFFSKMKNFKKKSKIKPKMKIEEKDFIKIDANTVIKGNLEYVAIDEQPTDEIFDYELFDLTYKSEEELKNKIKEDKYTFANFFRELETQEMCTLRKFSTKIFWGRLRIYVKSFIIPKNVDRFLAEVKLPDIKTRAFGFKKKLMSISSNILGQNTFF